MEPFTFGWIKITFVTDENVTGCEELFPLEFKHSGGLLFCTFWAFFSRPSWKVTIFLQRRCFFCFFQFSVWCCMKVCSSNVVFCCFFFTSPQTPALKIWKTIYSIYTYTYISYAYGSWWGGVGEFAIHINQRFPFLKCWICSIFLLHSGNLSEQMEHGPRVEDVGVSKNRGTPKWMVYNGKPY